jgi:hypothetical protein
MSRPSDLALLAVPIALLVWCLVPSQQKRPGGEIDVLNETIPPLPSELVKRRISSAAEFGVRETPQSWPRLVARPDGGAWLIGVEWEPGKGDRILARALLADGSPAKGGDGRPLPALEVNAAPCEAMRPTGAVDGDGRLVVAWTETTDAGPVVKMARQDGERFGPPCALTEAGRAARNVELARHGGVIWSCFEAWTPPAAGSDRGNIDVFLAPIEGNALGKLVAIGDGVHSELDPVIASDGKRLWVAWSHYQGRDFEIELRSYDSAAAKLGESIDVSACAQSDDVHPSLAAGKEGELWLAWDAIVDPGRGASTPKSYANNYLNVRCGAFVMTACVRDGKVWLPLGRLGEEAGVVVGVPHFSWTGGLPQIAVASDGAPWIAYRYLATGARLDRYGYAVVAHHWNGAGWSAPLQFQHDVGADEEPALLALEGDALVAWSQDMRLDFAPGAASTSVPPNVVKALVAADVQYVGWTGESALRVARAKAGEATGGAASASATLGAALVERIARPDPPHFHPAADPIADPYVTGARHFVIEQGDKRWQVYWGDLHRHSCVSRCSRGTEERPVQRWDFGRDVHGYDFMALTDHSGQIDPFSWWLEDKLVRLERTPDFCTLAGYEWSSIDYGHHNVILTGRLQPLLLQDCEASELYAKLASRDAVAIPHGTADLGRYAEFSTWDESIVRLVEVYQALRGNSEFDGCLKQSNLARVEECFVQDGLSAGRKFGLIASSDHGNGCAYAVALAQRLDPQSLMEAFRARRTYGATTKGMLIDFRIDGHVMGEECACAAPPALHVKVRGAADLAEVVVFRDSRVLFALGRPAASRDGTIELSLRLDLKLNPKSGGDWTLELAAPGCELERRGGSKAFHRQHPNPPYPKWRPDDASASFIWPGTFDPDEVDHQYRLNVRGRSDAKVTLKWDEQTREMALAELLERRIEGVTPRGPFEITATEPPDAQIDLSHGLAVREVEHEWTDPSAGPGAHWYYARAIQADGEMVWSSPIFVTRR